MLQAPMEGKGRGRHLSILREEGSNVTSEDQAVKKLDLPNVPAAVSLTQTETWNSG